MKYSLTPLAAIRLAVIAALIFSLSACISAPQDKQKPAKPVADNSPSKPKPATCPTVSVKACPALKPHRCPLSPAARIADKLLIGGVENVYVAPPGQVFTARIDTGAAGTSIHASNIVTFEKDGQDWVRFQIDHPSIATAIAMERPLARTVRVKQASSESLERRLVVKMTITLGSLSEQIDVSLSERSAMTYPLLLGRNFLRNLAVVDVSQRLIVK